MKLKRTEADLFEALRDIPVIDAHEHLVPEARRVEKQVDFSILFAHYTRADLISAGMNAEAYQRLINDDAMPAENPAGGL